MTDKAGLRKVVGRAVKPRPPKPEPDVSGNIELTGGPIYMPLSTGDDDTEIHFVAGGEVVGVVRLLRMEMNSNKGITAEFADLSHFMSHQIPVFTARRGGIQFPPATEPGPDPCSHGTLTFEGVRLVRIR